MSYEYRNFSLQIKLQHITAVKICQLLWRQPDVVEKVERHIFTKRGPEREIIHYVISKKLHELLLPTTIKNDLKFYLESMGTRMFEWLKCDLRMQRIEPAIDDEEEMSYFINNFSWHYFGCVDGKRMLESYVSKKESIDFYTWCQLCYYCCEFYIRKFSSTVSWDDCAGNTSIFPLFWHYKIHGNFPNDPSDRYGLRRYFNIDQMLNERTVTQAVFIESMRVGNMWSCDYCWNQLEDEQTNSVIFSVRYTDLFNLTQNSHSARSLHFFGQMSNEQLDHFMRTCLMRSPVFLMDWPWILCIPSWNGIFSCLDNHAVGSWQLALDNLNIINEMGGKKYKGSLYLQYRRVLEELWESNFGSTFAYLEPSDAIDLSLRIVRLEDVKLCQLIFAGASETRKQLLARLRRYLHFSELGGLEDDFWKAFVAEILVNDDERKFFTDIFE